MQQNYIILSGENAMSENGILNVYFEAFSSKKGHVTTSANNCKQSCSSDSWCFTFTGKEKDEETGYGYFGARYMDHELMTMWLSVDPMADKYPSISPYAYCAWNPVRLVDPDGMELHIPNAESDNHSASKTDLLSIVKERYKRYVQVGDDGTVTLSDEVSSGMIKNDKGLSLLKDLIDSDKKILYETSDDVSSVYRDGKQHAMTDDSWTERGIVNASLNGLDSRGTYTHIPKAGFDGHVIIAKSGDWFETDSKGFLNNIRKSILFHELAENYYRTDKGLDYNEAHQQASKREGFLFHRNNPGTMPRATSDSPRDGFYYRIKPS